MISDDLETNIKRIFLPSAERRPLEYFFQSSSLPQPLPPHLPWLLDSKGCYCLTTAAAAGMNIDFRAQVTAEYGYEHEPNLKILHDSTRPCNETLQACSN